jgi:heme-degrading monooxygenase HmoA
MGSFHVLPGQLDELAEVYARDCAPLVRAWPGNVDCFLAEPTGDGEPMVASTVWRTEADAKHYEASGTAQEVVGKVRRFFAGPPTLRTYRVRGR